MNIPAKRWDLPVILILTALLFLPSLVHSFVSWDDETHLTENPQVRSLAPENIASIFHSEVNKTYIPLTIFSFALEYKLAGLNPVIYHLDNLLLHMGVVAILYFLILRLGYSSLVASTASLIFGIHPMHVESVVWVTARKDVLYGLFYLLSLWQYVVYVQERKVSAYGWALVCAGLSILAKPMALSLPLVICLVDWLLKRGFSWRLIWEKLPFALIVFPVAWITYAMNMRTIDLQYPQSFLIWIWCGIFYLLKFLNPAELLVLYEVPRPVSSLNPEFFWPLICTVLILSSLIRLRKNRTFLFAFGYFFLSIFFLLRFDVRQDLTIVADRFMYLPSVGFCLLFGLCVERAYQKISNKQAVSAAVAILIIVLSVLTWNRVRLWGREHELWEQVVRRYENGLAYGQLGNYFLRQGDLTQALSNYEKAVERLPIYSKPYSNRGIVLLKYGRYDEAVADFSKAIELDTVPAALTFSNRGYAFMKWKKYPQALADYDRAIAIDKRYVPAYLNRATLYKDQKDYERAMADLNRVLEIDQANAMASNNIQLLRKMMADDQSH